MKHFIIALSILICFFVPYSAFADISKRAEVKKFIDYMVKKHKFKRAELDDLFQHVVTKKKIIAAITRPAEAKPWYKYRKIFLTDKRINGGVKFWEQNASDLKRAYNKFGVPPEIIIAIIGVESLYGKHKGTYRMMDSLSTLAFDYPKRSKFFRSELEQYLLMAREEKVDALTLKGSYAGAMGKPQFIASSFRRYAIDFDNDGKRDLWNNSTDVIGSVANYFSKHKWKKDQPVTSPAKLKKSKQTKAWVKKGIKPSIKISTLLKNGVKIEDDFPHDEKAALLELEIKNGVEYWVGIKNFYVITRYNHSQLYAMAVYQLSQEIAKKRKIKLSLAN